MRDIPATEAPPTMPLQSRSTIALVVIGGLLACCCCLAIVLTLVFVPSILPVQ